MRRGIVWTDDEYDALWKADPETWDRLTLFLHLFPTGEEYASGRCPEDDAEIRSVMTKLTDYLPQRQEIHPLDRLPFGWKVKDDLSRDSATAIHYWVSLDQQLGWAAAETRRMNVIL